MALNKEAREMIIWKLYLNKDLGFYKGMDENSMKFEECSDEELEWYRDEWIMTEYDFQEDQKLIIDFYDSEQDFKETFQ